MGAALQQKLGNQGAQVFASQIMSRASAPASMFGGGAALGEFAVSHPDDAHEREAERVADHVMRSAETGQVSSSPSSSSKVHRVCAECEEEMSGEHIDRAAEAGGASQVAVPVAANIHDMQGGGSLLPPATRAFFEPRFGADFSHVRVHTGGRADATAKAVGAKAFTVGSDIVFAGGQFAPESQEGQHLLAHELTHVVQQDGGASRVSRKPAPADPGIAALSNTPTIQRFDLPFGYETDISWQGVETAAGVVRDTVAEGLQWVVDEITELVDSAIAWLGEQWNRLQAAMQAAFDAAKAEFGNIVSFLLSPFGFLADALMNLDPAALSRAWVAFSGVVKRVGDGFKALAAGLLRPFEATWNWIDERVTGALNHLSGLVGNFVFRRLPNFMQRIARDAIAWLKRRWKEVSDLFTAFVREIKTWVDGAIDVVVRFVDKVASFAIDVVIAALVKVAQVIAFLADFVANPRKYIDQLAKRCVQAFDGVEARFAGVVSQYFGAGPAVQTATAAAPVKLSRTPADAAAAEPRTSASWSQIGDGILEMMDAKWQAFKAHPMSLVTALLLDMFLPVVGNVEDLIKLYQGIKKVVTGPLHADSLQDLWTSLLQLLDIPIMIYNTFISMLMRTLMLPLLVASFVPAVREIAVGIGLELLVAFLAGVEFNLVQKILLLHTGLTGKKQKEDAYNSIADNLIALAITAVIALLMLLLPAIYGLMRGIYNFVKGKVFGIKVPPVEVKATAPPESKSQPTEQKPSKAPPKDEPTPPNEPSLGYENGKRVVAEEPTADGKHKIKVTEDGVCLRCSDCGTLIKDYAIELNDPKNAALLAELEAAETTANPKLKAWKMAKIEEKLAEIRKNNPHPNDPIVSRKARIEILGKDPAQGGKVTPSTLREAEVAVSLEEAGQVKGPVRRDPTGGADFIDGDGKPWDVKGFDSGHSPAQGGFDLATDAAKVDKSLSLGEDVMMDTGKMTAADAAALKAEGVKRGWGDRVKFFP